MGGNNAIDYLTKVEGMDFVSAVRLLNEMAPVAASFQPAKAAPVKPHEPRPFTLPTPDRNVEAVAAYPVSYTHLDVYKRQQQRRKGAVAFAPAGVGFIVEQRFIQQIIMAALHGACLLYTSRCV